MVLASASWLNTYGLVLQHQTSDTHCLTVLHVALCFTECIQDVIAIKVVTLCSDLQVLTPRQQRGRVPSGCTLQLTCLVPAAAAQRAGQPTQVLLKVSNPRLIVLRRFVNNIAFVAEQIKSRMSLLAEGSAGMQSGKSVRPAANPAASDPEAPPTGTCVTVRVADMQVRARDHHSTGFQWLGL